jgi:hypothetical protein
MTRQIAVLLTGLFIVGADRAYAQEATPGPGALEVTVIPGGGTFYTSGDRGPSFGNYNLGGALTYNINRIVGIEGEVAGTLGVAQDLQFGGLTNHQKGPNQLNYAGALVLSAPTRRDRRSFDVPASQPRRHQDGDVPDGQRRRRSQVVRAERPVGRAR